MAGCLWKSNLVSHFLFPLSKLSLGSLFCCFPCITLNFLRICCPCWDDFEVQAGCAGVAVMQAVVRAQLSFSAQAHQSYRLHEILCSSEQVSLFFWLLPGSKHCQQVKNSVMSFAGHVKWKWTCSHASCSHRGGSDALMPAALHKTRAEETLCSLSLASSLPGQTYQDRLPAFMFSPFSMPAGAVLRVFFSQPANAPLHLYLALLELVSVGSLEMWPSYEAICTFLFLNEKVKKPPSNEQFVRSELSTSEDESSSQLTLTRFDHVTVGVSKTQKEGTDGHTHTIIHMLKLCVPLLCPFFTCFAWAVEAFSLIALNIVFLSHWVCKIYRACFWQLGIWLLHAQFWTRFWKVPS